MNYMLVAITGSVFFCSFLTDLKWMPGWFKFGPEVLSGILAVWVIILGIKQRFQLVRPAYWLVFSALSVTMLFGVLANMEAPGPILLGGMRFYLRAMPLFFVPAVVAFTERDIGKQLRLMLYLALLQVPISGWQRYVIYSQHRFSGDNVFGTLMISGNLSIFLIGVIAILTGMYLRKRISLVTYILLFFILLAPTTINETKATIFLLPLGLIAALMIGSPGRRIPMALTAVGLLAVFGTIFVPVYDYFNTTNTKQGFTLEKFFTDKRLGGSYLDQKATLGTRKEAGRVDSLMIPLQMMAEDPVQMVFGLGMGNASISSLGPQFTGKYAAVYNRYAVESSISAWLLEIGMSGVILVLLLLWFVWKDTLFVAQADRGLLGAFAIGWAATTMVMVLSLFYLEMHVYESASYLYWYFSGLMAATRARYGLPASEPMALSRQVSPT